MAGSLNVITQWREGVTQKFFDARTSAIQQAFALRASTGSVQNARASHIKHI